MGLSAGAWYGLGEFFEALAARHPGLRLHVHQQSTRPLLDAVRAGTLDLAVGLCVRDPGDLAARRLKDEPVILVISAVHPLAGRPTATLDDVREETFALDDPAEGTDYNAAVMGSAPARASRPPPVSCRPTTTPGNVRSPPATASP